MGEIFETRHDLDQESRELLSEAYTRACRDLQQSASDRNQKWLQSTLVEALIDLYRAGQRDPNQLARYASFCAKFKGLDI